MGGAKYTKEMLEEAVKGSRSLHEVLGRLGFASYSGSTSSHIRERLKFFEVNIDHLQRRSTKGRPPMNKKTPDQIFVKRTVGRGRTRELRRALLETGVPYVCECGQGADWNGKPLTLSIDHRNGDHTDDRLVNLRFLCPNCHSQTETFGIRNMRRG